MSLQFKIARFWFNAVPSNRREFYEDFASSLRDGASNIDQLKKMALRARRRKTGWAPLYEHWIRKMRRMSFGYALQHTVPPYEVMVLTAAEEDGRLDEAMDYLARSIQLLGKVRSIYFISLFSPAISLLVIIGFLSAYALIIAPEYLQIIPLEKWPLLNRAIYTVADALVSKGVLFITGAIGIFSIVNWSKPNWHGRLRKKIDRIPLTPWSSYRQNEGNNFLISLSILLQSNNHGIKEALEMMRKFSTPWLTWHITLMLHRLTLTPNRPALALDTGIFDLRMMDRIEDYADRSEFNRAIYKLAFDSGEKFVERAQKRALFIGVVAMFFVAVMVLIIAFSNIQFSQATEAALKTI